MNILITSSKTAFSSSLLAFSSAYTSLLASLSATALLQVAADSKQISHYLSSWALAPMMVINNLSKQVFLAASSSSRCLSSASESYNHQAKSQAARISLASKSVIESFKCYSNLSIASNNLFPMSLSAVPAPMCSVERASLLLSVALSSHYKAFSSTG